MPDRLPEEVNKPTVAVDLDGVLAEYDGWKGVKHIGDPIPGARQFIERLREHFRVVLFTTRTSTINCREGVTLFDITSRLECWLSKHRIEVDDIHTGPGKPLCAAIIDDRAVSCRPQADARGPDMAYREALMMTLMLARGVEWGDAQEAYARLESRECDHPAAVAGRCSDCGELLEPPAIGE
jgi:hypothetical protein